MSDVPLIGLWCTNDSDSSQCSTIIQQTNWCHFCIRGVEKWWKSCAQDGLWVAGESARKYAERSTLFDTVHSLLKPKFLRSLNLNCSEVLREENMDLIPTQQTTYSLLTRWFWSTGCLFLFEMVDIQLCILIQKRPFSKYQWPNLCITTFPHSLWCKDACSVYNITTRKCRVVLTLSLCMVSLQKASQNNHSYLCFVLNFLFPGKHNLQIGNVTSTDGICRECWEEGGCGPLVFWECSRVGVRGDDGTRGECMRVV